MKIVLSQQGEGTSSSLDQSPQNNDDYEDLYDDTEFPPSETTYLWKTTC